MRCFPQAIGYSCSPRPRTNRYALLPALPCPALQFNKIRLRPQSQQTIESYLTHQAPTPHELFKLIWKHAIARIK